MSSTTYDDISARDEIEDHADASYDTSQHSQSNPWLRAAKEVERRARMESGEEGDVELERPKTTEGYSLLENRSESSSASNHFDENESCGQTDTIVRCERPLKRQKVGTSSEVEKESLAEDDSFSSDPHDPEVFFIYMKKHVDLTPKELTLMRTAYAAGEQYYANLEKTEQKFATEMSRTSKKREKSKEMPSAKFASTMCDLRVNEAFDAFLMNAENTHGSFQMHSTVHLSKLEGHVRKQDALAQDPFKALARSRVVGFYGLLSGPGQHQNSSDTSDDPDRAVYSDASDTEQQYIEELSGQTFMTRRPSSDANDGFAQDDNIWVESHIMALDNTGIVKYVQAFPCKSGVKYSRTKKKRRPRKVKPSKCFWVPFTEQHVVSKTDDDVKFVQIRGSEVNEYVRVSKDFGTSSQSSNASSFGIANRSDALHPPLDTPSTSTSTSSVVESPRKRSRSSSEILRWKKMTMSYTSGKMTPRSRSSITGVSDSPRRTSSIGSPLRKKSHEARMSPFVLRQGSEGDVVGNHVVSNQDSVLEAAPPPPPPPRDPVDISVAPMDRTGKSAYVSLTVVTDLEEGKQKSPDSILDVPWMGLHNKPKMTDTS